MSESMQPSYRQRLIEQQLLGVAIYLHKPTGIRYHLAYTVGGTNELHPISGACRYATDEQLANTEIWERKP